MPALTIDTSKIFSVLDGYKTHITVIAGILVQIAAKAGYVIDPETSYYITAALTFLALSFMRSGIKKDTEVK